MNTNIIVSIGFSYNSDFYQRHCKTHLGKAVKGQGKGDAIYPANYCIKIKVDRFLLDSASNYIGYISFMVTNITVINIKCFGFINRVAHLNINFSRSVCRYSFFRPSLKKNWICLDTFLQRIQICHQNKRILLFMS